MPEMIVAVVNPDGSLVGSGGGGAVSSVAGKTGDVVLDAEDIASGTFDVARIPTGTSGTTVSLGNHTHAASAVTSGTFAIAQIPTGTTATTVALGNHTHPGLMTGSATNVPDSAAADVATLVTNFNALLDALAARGVITNT